MNIYTPYIYLIGWPHLDMYYIGCEYGEKTKIAHPTNLWNTYYTSSKHVKKFVEENGDLNIIQVRKTFQTAVDTVKYESRILRRLNAKNHPKFLNQHNGDGKFGKIGFHSEETRRKMSETRRGKQGKPISEETRQKISETMRGKPSPKKGMHYPKVLCPHCGKIGGGSSMHRWHFDNCKFHPTFS